MIELVEKNPKILIKNPETLEFHLARIRES